MESSFSFLFLLALSILFNPPCATTLLLDSNKSDILPGNSIPNADINCFVPASISSMNNPIGVDPNTCPAFDIPSNFVLTLSAAFLILFNASTCSDKCLFKSIGSKFSGLFFVNSSNFVPKLTTDFSCSSILNPILLYRDSESSNDPILLTIDDVIPLYPCCVANTNGIISAF